MSGQRALRRGVMERVKPAPGNKKVIVIREYDYIIFVSVILLVIFGLIMIFSSSYYSLIASNESMYATVRGQAICAAIGLCCMIIAASVDYEVVAVWGAPILYLAAMVSLVLVVFIGKEVNGAKRWINVFDVFQFQPSELAKAAVILMLAVYISRDRSRVITLRGLIGCGVIVGIPVFLVFLGNNLSTAIIICAIAAGMIFIASPYFWRYLALAGAAGAALLTYLLAFSDSFRAGRVAAWLDPFSDPSGTGYQTIQGLYAIASGGMFGLGLGKSNQKLIYIPEAENDMIFAIICEELGFVGAAIVLLLFAVLVWRGAMAAVRATNLVGTMLAAGIVTLIAVQVVINVGVVTNTLPNTGIPLPFISQGGTSIIVMMSLMGVLLNVSRRAGSRDKPRPGI